MNMPTKPGLYWAKYKLSWGSSASHTYPWTIIRRNPGDARYLVWEVFGIQGPLVACHVMEMFEEIKPERIVYDEVQHNPKTTM